MSEEKKPKEEIPAVEAPPMSITDVVRSIEAACLNTKFLGGPETPGIRATPIIVSCDVAENTLKNVQKITRVYRLESKQFVPTQVNPDTTLTGWGLQGIANAIKPLSNLVGYKFAGGLRTGYVFAGSYGDGYLICITGYVPPE